MKTRICLKYFVNDCRFETVSLPYLYDLIIPFSMQLFFLKSYSWSLNLKIPVIISGATLIFDLNLSVDGI